MRIVKVANLGRVESVLCSPDLSETETTYVERINRTLCQWCQRFNRKTYAFSRKPRMLECALALAFLHYNLCLVHKTLRATPAMAARVTDHVWDIEELLVKAYAVGAWQPLPGMRIPCYPSHCLARSSKFFQSVSWFLFLRSSATYSWALVQPRT